MIDQKPKPFLSLELRCVCGSSLFVELPQEPNYSTNELPKSVVQLGVAFTNAHAAHHQEPAKK